MRKSVFIEAVNRQKRFASWCARLGSFFIIPLVFLTIYLIPKYTHLYLDHPALSRVPVFIFFAITAAMFWLMFRNFKKLGLYCPHCKKRLDSDLWRIALTTYKCGNCGEAIIEDEDQKTT
jgi:hypothetical protein